MKNRTMKRLLSLLLCLSMCLALGLSANAEAPEEEPAQEEPEETILSAEPEGVSGPGQPLGLNYGYYLIGRYGWTIDDLDESRDMFQQNYASSTEEYKLLTTLEEGQQIKVVKVSNGTDLGPWFPDGDNITVDAAHAGNKIIYFRPDYNADWAQFGGYLWIDDPPTYHVNISQPAHGMLVPDKFDAAEGEMITVTAVPDAGYYPAQQMKASPNPSNTSWPDAYHFCFTMPASNVTVSIGWNQMCVDEGYYFSVGLGSQDLSPAEKFQAVSSAWGEYAYEATLTEGDDFSLTRILTRPSWSWNPLHWEPGVDWTVTAEMAGHVKIFLSSTAAEGYVKAFDYSPYTQGSEDLWLTVRHYQPILLAPAEHGTLSARADAFEGEGVFVSVTPEEGYMLDTFTVTDADGDPVPTDGTSFTMPDSPVTVTATFKTTEVYTVTLVGAEDGVNITSTKQTAQEGDTVDVNITTDSNHRFVSITVTDEQGTVIPTTKRPDGANKYRFTMPASNVTVTVVCKTIYPLYLINTQVDSLNCGDILGDGTASYDPATRTLSFSSAEPAFGSAYGTALILWTSEESLTIDAPNGLHLAGNTTYCINSYTNAGEITVNGDLILDIPQDSNGVWVRLLTVNGNVSGTVKAIALYGSDGVTVNGSVSVTNQDSIRTVFSSGKVKITGDFSAVGYGIDAAGGIEIGGSVTIAGSTTANNYGLQSANGAVSVGGDFSFSGKALYAVSAAQGFRCDGNVTVSNTSGRGIYSASGAITVVSGVWDAEAVSDPLKAAAGILIPEDHQILLPEGGVTAAVTENGNTYTVVCEADGTTPAAHVVIGPSAPTGFHIIVDDYTNGLAAASIDAEALYTGEVSFTVSSDENDTAVAVGIVNADGTLTRLACTTADGVHSFTVTVADADVTIALVFKGDADLNGRVQTRDGTLVKQILVELRQLDEEKGALQVFAVDQNDDGAMQNREATMISQVIVGSRSYAW